MNDNDLTDLFSQIGKTVQDITSPENISELKRNIDRTVSEVKASFKQNAVPPKGKPAARPAPPPPVAHRAVRPAVVSPPVAPEKRLAVPSNRVPGHAAGPLLTVLGYGGLLFSAAGLISVFTSFPIVLGTLLGYSAFAAVSAAAVVRGSALRGRVGRYRTYLNVLSGAAFCSVRALAAAVDKSVKFVVRDLKKMIRHGFFPQGHVDGQGSFLILDDETYGQYLSLMERSRLQEEEAQQRQEQLRSNPELDTVIREGEHCLAEIREANAAIPGEEISRKLSRLESVTGKIFDYVTQHPQKLPEIRRFMSYYLPTTLKLVSAYREFDAQPVQGETILASKREIEETLDTINVAFENLFDGLFEDDALDVSTDISVLETMLRQEGLTGSDFKPKN